MGFRALRNALAFVSAFVTPMINMCHIFYLVKMTDIDWHLCFSIVSCQCISSMNLLSLAATY